MDITLVQKSHFKKCVSHMFIFYTEKNKQKPQMKATHCRTKDCQETGLNTKLDGAVRSFKSMKKKLV